MEGFAKLFKSKSRKAIEHFVNYLLNDYYNGIDEYGNKMKNLTERSLSS